MATHSCVLAWRIPEMGEPGGLPSVGSHRVRHDWSDLAAATRASLVAQMVKNPPVMQETRVWSLGWEDPLKKGMATRSSILARESHEWRSQVGYSLWGCRVGHNWVTHYITANVLGKSRGLWVDWATTWYHWMLFCTFSVHSDFIPDSKSTGSSPSLWAWHSRLVSTQPLPLLLRLITSAAASSSLRLAALRSRCIVGCGQVNGAIWACSSLHLECPHLSGIPISSG